MESCDMKQSLNNKTQQHLFCFFSASEKMLKIIEETYSTTIPPKESSIYV
jgi:hypothetical protein